MARPIQQPLVGVVARYQGVYRPHWEIAHIAVRGSRISTLCWAALMLLCSLVAFWLGMFGPKEFCVCLAGAAVLAAVPPEEHWAPNSSRDCKVALDEEGGRIEFEGIVSALGRYGHHGFMCRKVEIIRILRYRGRRLEADDQGESTERGAAADRSRS
jgi:hypothetical protein